MKKLVAALSASFVVFGAAAQTSQSTTTLGSTVNTLKKAGLGFSVYNEASTNRDADNKINGFTNILEPTIIYKTSSKGKLKFYNDFETTNNQDEDAKTIHSWSALRYQHTLLSEASAGVSMSGMAYLAAYPNGELQDSRGTNGYTQLRLNVSKEVASGLVFGAQARQYIYKSNDAATITSRKGITRGILTADYEINDTFAVGAYLDNVNFKMRNSKSTHSTKLAATGSFNLNKQVNFGAEVSGVPFVSNDQKTIADDWTDSLGYLASVTLTAF